VEDSWIQPFYGYGITFMVGAAMAVVLLMLSRKTNGKKREMLISFAIVGFGAAVSVILVTGGRFVIGEVWSYEWKDPLVMESAFVTLTLLFWYRLYRLNKQDKGL
jgi:hypothetical protein